MMAIILDGHLKSALCAARSLGRKGVIVSVGAGRTTAMSFFSKYAKDTFVYPSPYHNQIDFKNAVIEEAKKLGNKPVVLAFSDATYLSLYAFREELQEYVTLVFPSDESVNIAFDKIATYDLAKESGIPLIETNRVNSFEDVEELIPELTFPLVVKSRQSVIWKDGIGIFGTAGFVHNADELRQCVRDIKDHTGVFPILQTFIKGDEYGVEMLADHGAVRAIAMHRRIRSLSPTGGASVLKETVLKDPLTEQMERHARTLVAKLEWSGPIMIEFKVDSKLNQPLLMEINGRFWGSLPLEVAAGVDFPYLYQQFASTGLYPVTEIKAQEGVVTRHFLGDVQHLLRVLFKREAMRPYLYPNRFAALCSFIVVPSGTRSDIWSPSDIMPSVMEYIDAAFKSFSKK